MTLQGGLAGALNDSALLQLVGMVRDTGYRFVTVSPMTHQRVNSRPGNESAVNLAGVFGWSRPFSQQILPVGMFELMRHADALVEIGKEWKSKIRISTLDDKFFVHSAYPTISSDSVFFGPDTYRFTSAIMAHLEACKTPIRRAVDICCGAGSGAIVIAKAVSDAEIVMTDINSAALRLARVNAALADVHNAKPYLSSILSAVEGTFDLIVANPPYLVDSSLRAYRHGGGPLGASLSLAIVESAIERLASAGMLVLYTGAAVINGIDPFKEIAGLKLSAADFAWSYKEVDPDVFGEELESEAYRNADRIAAVVLTARRR